MPAPVQSALVLVNTRLVDRVLGEPAWAGRIDERTRKALTPLFWSNVRLHGEFPLNLHTPASTTAEASLVGPASRGMLFTGGQRVNLHR